MEQKKRCDCSWKIGAYVRKDSSKPRSLFDIRGSLMCTLKASHYKDAPKIMIYRDVAINEGNKRDYKTNT